MAYGAITAVDTAEDKVVVATESGEVFTMDILTNIQQHN